MIKQLLKKEWFKTTVTVLIAFLFLPMHLSSRDFNVKNVTYTVLDEDAKTVMVTDASVYGDLELPSKVTDSGNEYSVTAIGESAFANSTLSMVSLPETLKSIGANAFANQKEMYYIEFPEGLEEIGDNAFFYCQILQFPSFPESLKKIGESAFVHCDAQLSITLPRNIQSLGVAAFKSMYKLKKAVLFSDLEELPDWLFAHCMCLEEVYLPQRLKIIGDEAFKWSHLEEIILPKTLEKIGVEAFVGDERSGIWTNGEEWIIECKLSKINFPENLREIGDRAFYRQPIRNVVLNEGLLKIGSCAFYDNSELSVLQIPTTLEEIGEQAFASSEESSAPLIGSVSLLHLKKLGEGAFYSRPIGSLNIGDGITELNASQENSYYTLNIGLPRVLTLGENLKSLSPKLIFPNSDLKVFQLKSSTPPKVTASFPLTENEIDNILVIVKDGTKDLYLRNPYWKVFGSSIVEESEADITVYVDGQYPISEEIRVQAGLMPSQVVKMKVTGKLADSDWRLIRENMLSLISLDLSGISNTEIPDNAFQNMSMLTDIVLPTKITRIGKSAFNNCKLLKLSELPDGVTEIGNGAFENCLCITISNLPEALEIVDGIAFRNCISLRTITAGSNLKQLCIPKEDPIYGDKLQRWGFNTFEKCTSLEYVDLSASQIELMYDFFADCPNLSTVILPESVELIGNGAFANTGLTSLEIPSNVSYIGESAFANTKIRGITIPEGITKIGGSTFSNCPKLLNVNLPQSMSEIGINLFSGDNKLTAISCRALTAPTADEGAFNDMNRKKCGLTVPQQSFRSYLNAPGWGGFQNILNRLEVECPDDDVEITAVDEEEYQEIIEEEQLQQEAEESAEDENFGNDPDQPTPQMMRAKARKQLTNGANYALLFDGATVATPTTTKGTRIFINQKKDGELIGVYYNDLDVTDKMEGNSYLLPIKANGKLLVKFKSAGIENIVYNEVESETCTAYDFMGRIVYTGDRSQFNTSVKPGIYIVKCGSKTEKIAVK